MPKHIILKGRERERLFKTYGVTTKHLPRILDSDPAIKAIGGTIGDVIKIVRKSPTAGETNYYRVVVKG